MTTEERLIINDIERMSESLQKLIRTIKIKDPKSSYLKTKGLVDIQRGTTKVVNSILNK